MNANLTNRRCITLDDGFEVKIKSTDFDNYEFLDAMTELSDGNVLALTKIVNLVLDKDEKVRVLDHIRNEDGVASATGMEKIITEIFEKIKGTDESAKK